MLAAYLFSDSYTSRAVLRNFARGGRQFHRDLALAFMLIFADVLSGSGDFLRRWDDGAFGWCHQHV